MKDMVSMRNHMRKVVEKKTGVKARKAIAANARKAKAYKKKEGLC